MASQQNGEGVANPDADFAEAFKELARGERAAAAMENHLNSLEKKIEELLAKAEEEERMMKRDPQSKQAADKPTTNGQGKDAL